MKHKGFTLIELMMVVVILAILAVVAVPAFIKYMRRAKTTEAIDELDKLNKASATYFSRGAAVTSGGVTVGCQFPSGQAMTPDITGLNCCGGAADADSDDRCDVDPSLWNSPTWSALDFQMSDEHYFGYSYTSSGEEADAKFTAHANADLDCDGTLSTFERYGYASDDSQRAECSLKQASAMYVSFETE